MVITFPDDEEGTTYEVTCDWMDGTEMATVDKRGTLRDSQGKAYSQAYEVVDNE